MVNIENCPKCKELDGKEVAWKTRVGITAYCEFHGLFKLRIVKARWVALKRKVNANESQSSA